MRRKNVDGRLMEEADRLYAMADAHKAAARYALTPEFGYGDIGVSVAETFIKFARDCGTKAHDMFDAARKPTRTSKTKV